MQVSETLNQGLKREIKVIVPASDLEGRLAARLDDARGKAQIRGFRPGKVPAGHLRKLYGKSFMAEIVNEILNETPRSVLHDRGEKAAMQPEISMTEDEAEAARVLDGKADFEFSIAYEIVPKIAIVDVSGIAITREVYDVPEDEVDEQVLKVAESARTYETRKGKAENGDRVTIDYLGKIDGEPFDGGADSGSQLVLGSGRFIPGFEEQLVGVKAGDEKVINVTFPAEYPAANLAGKAATFDISVKEVAKPGKLELTDEIAKSLGIESAERLREVVRQQIESQFGTMTRQKVKRQLLDALDGVYKFEAPSRLIEAEFTNIWNQVNRELTEAGKSFADEDTTEDEAKAEYQRLAERRVRLGLVLAEIGEQAGVTVTDEELQRALFATAQQYRGQEQQVFDFYRNNPDALASLRAPIFEEKVVDHLLAQVSVTDRKVSKGELMADDEGGEAAEKPAKKKAPARKKASKEA